MLAVWATAKLAKMAARRLVYMVAVIELECGIESVDFGSCRQGPWSYITSREQCFSAPQALIPFPSFVIQLHRGCVGSYYRGLVATVVCFISLSD